MKLLSCFLFLVVPTFVYAGVSDGLITQPLAHGNGFFMFSAGTHLNKPTCSTQGDAWALDASTSGGKSMQATLLTAHALGKKVHVEGKGVCDAWGDRETPSYVLIVD